METELQKIYASEINVEISWLWDGGIDVKLGDAMNGYRAETNVNTVAEVIPWLQRAIARYYPDSDYTKSLGAEIQPLEDEPALTVCTHQCPHCGVVNSFPGWSAVNSFPGWSAMLAYVCKGCSEGVTVDA